MAGDKKISQLDAIPSIHDDDLLAIVDDTDTTTKKATAAQFKEHVKVVGVKDEFTPTAGQVNFTLSAIPSGDAALIALVNGKGQVSTKYSFTGTAFTWGNVPPFIVGDTLIIKYNSEAPVFGLYKGTYAGTMPAVATNLLVTAAQLGLTSARQIVIPRLMVQLGSPVNSWTPDGNNIQDPQSKCDIFIPKAGEPQDGDLYISTGIGATLVAGQPFEFIYLYQSTNFLS